MCCESCVVCFAWEKKARKRVGEKKKEGIFTHAHRMGKKSKAFLLTLRCWLYWQGWPQLEQNFMPAHGLPHSEQNLGPVVGDAGAGAASGAGAAALGVSGSTCCSARGRLSTSTSLGFAWPGRYDDRVPPPPPKPKPFWPKSWL